MTVNIQNHYTGHLNGQMIEFGTSSFSGTALTKQIPCSLNKPISVLVTPKSAPNTGERYFCDLTNDGGTTTVTRVCTLRVASFAIDNGQFVASDLPWTPLMIAQRGMRFSTGVQVEWFHGTAFGSGTPTFALGTSTSNGSIVPATAITTPTTANATSTFTTFTTEEVAVADGTVIGAMTTGGSGTSVTASATTTGTPSATISPSVTTSLTTTGTPSVTPTEEAGSSTPSKSITASATPSLTVTATPTVSITASVTQSATPSVTADASVPADVVITVSYFTPESGLEFSYIIFGPY